MNLQVAPPKCQQVADYLEEEIQSGKLKPGERVYSTIPLSRKFKVSRAVISSAYEILEKKGLISRQKGRGTFVRDRSRFTQKTFALLTTYFEGHIEGYFESLNYEFYKKSSFCFCTQLNGRKSLQMLLEQDIDALMLDIHPDQIRKTVNYIRKHAPDLPCCGVHRLPEMRSFPYPAIVINETRIFRDSIKHLLDKGHEKILLLTYSETLTDKEVNSLKTIAEELGVAYPLPFLEQLCVFDFENNPSRVKRVFAGRNYPRAIIGTSDQIIANFVEKMEATKPAIVFDDFIGRYNTVWSRQKYMTFSSFIIDFGQIWQRAYDLFTNNWPADASHVEFVDCQPVWR